MKLYNTHSRKVEEFIPRSELVTVYVCGITPYDTTHLGHAFTYTSMDCLIRYLEYRGLHVKYVQNITDIDDDILRKAGEAGENWRDLGTRWTDFFVNDLKMLNVRPPDVFPRATQVIEDIQRAVLELIELGAAYEVDGWVYYDIDRYPRFGTLSQMSRQEMLPVANERGNNPLDTRKKNPLDFVLWQSRFGDEPYWDSPWGQGRPGWHIECSTMSTKFLGETVDIHGGGSDLCFPHHECEIAQVAPVLKDKPFVRYWVHTAMVRHDGEKMSKSLGNLVMVRMLLREYTPDAIRLMLAGHHYRSVWEYSEKELKDAQKLAVKLREAALVSSGNDRPFNPDPAVAGFVHDMDNDLDTPGAIKVLEDFAGQISAASLANRDIQEAQSAFRAVAGVLGLRLDAQLPEERVVAGWDDVWASE